MTSIAIMQPTYLPWLGYFHLLDQADHFVFLDNVQLSHQSWQTRNRISGPTWLSIPIKRRYQQQLADTRIDNTQDWQHKHWTAITNAYQHASHWLSLQRLLRPFYKEGGWARLTPFTISLTRAIANHLRITTPTRLASTIPCSNDRAQRLIDICHHLNADTFIEPAGGTYLLEHTDQFDQAGITIDWHDYNHPTYSQGNAEFTPYLSVIDLIAWHGPNAPTIIRTRQPIAA